MRVPLYAALRDPAVSATPARVVSEPTHRGGKRLPRRMCANCCLCRDTGSTMPDLSTLYLGLHLRNPLVPSASPLGASLDTLRRMEDAGASAVVLPSLFEEQIIGNSREEDFLLSHGTYSADEAITYFDEPPGFRLTPDAYLEHIQRAKSALDIPVIGSLNGVSVGGWVSYAHEIEQAGVDALELNIYYVPTNPHLEAPAIEREYVDVLNAVVRRVTIPVAVKLSPYFTNVASIASKLDQAGASGLVLFNRFYQPDIDLDTLTLVSEPSLTSPNDGQALRLPLCWIGILYGRLQASLAASSGVFAARDVVKLLMVGADVTMMASALMRHGVEHLSTVREGLEDWMDQHGYASVRQLRGSMSQQAMTFPSAFERAQYVRSVAAKASLTH
jgi:dihydroorotate dehydrogenase (fumarate)